MVMCPACGRPVRSLDLRRPRFACPWCKESLSWSWGLSRLECAFSGVLVIFGPIVIAFWLWPGERAPLAGGLLSVLLVVPITFVYFLIRLILVRPTLRRDSGWLDEGTVLHITRPPRPP